LALTHKPHLAWKDLGPSPSFSPISLALVYACSASALCRPWATTDAEPSLSQNSSCRRIPSCGGMRSASFRPAEKCAIASA
jgi:hypothetical protein